MLEEGAVYVLSIAVGAPTLAMDLAHGDSLGRTSTACLALIVLGVLGLARLTSRRVRLPRARSLPRRTGSHAREPRRTWYA